MAEATTLTVLDQLGESLILSSAALARVRRARGNAIEREVQTVDEAFSRSISLARALRERLLAAFDGEYASLANAARDVVRRIQATVPSDVCIALHCDLAPIVVAGTAPQLRYVIGALVNRALEGSVDVALIVREAWNGPRRVGEIVVRYQGNAAEEQHELSTDVQSAVSSLGGVLDVSADGAHVVVVIQMRAVGGDAA